MQAKALTPGLSDHSPIVLSDQGGSQGNTRMFRYCDMWANNEKLQEIVTSCWRVEFQPSYIFSQKLKEVKKALHRSKYGNIHSKCEEERIHMEYWQEKQRAYYQDPIIAKVSNLTTKDYAEKIHDYMSLMHQQSKVDWSLGGDVCSKRFMTYIKARKQMNRR